MSWGFTPEWLAERERRKKLKALGSTGPVDAPTVIGNCELIGLNKIDREHLQCRAAPSEGDSLATSRAVSLYPLVDLCEWARVAIPVPEYRFHEHRRWRFDYAWPLAMLACEIEGGLWSNGRHSRGKGAIADLEKYSEAAILGWRLIYATPQELENGVALDRVVRALIDRAAA